MGSRTFTASFELGESFRARQIEDAPCEIRDLRGALVHRGLVSVSRQVELPDDQFVCWVMRPNGEGLVLAGSSVSRELAAKGPIRLEVGEGLTETDRWRKTLLVGDRAARSVPCQVFSHLPMGEGWPQAGPPQEKELGTGRLSVDDGPPAILFIHYRVDDQTEAWTAVPASPQLPARLRVEIVGPFAASVDVLPSNENAAALLKLASRLRVDLELLLSESERSPAKELLEGKREDPVAAIIGAYVLCRSPAAMERNSWVGEVIKRLYCYEVLGEGPKGAKWLVDAAVLRALLYLREGEREDARQCLLRLREHGLPMLREGVTLAIDLLREICKDEDDPGADCMRQLRDLRLVARWTDPAKPFTTLVTPLERPQPWLSRPN